MDSGTYTLLLELETATVITFGAAGASHLSAGYYSYTGSAFGSGGLTRVNRHREVCTGTNTTRHWHIDYLLGASESSWDGVWTAPVARECVIDQSIPGTPIAGIGASDCGCESHLTYNPSREELVDELESVYRRLNQD